MSTKNMEIQQKLLELFTDCLITGEAERTASKVEYGDPNYWVKQACLAFADLVREEKPELPGIFTLLKDLTVEMYKKGTDEYESNLLSSLGMEEKV